MSATPISSRVIEGRAVGRWLAAVLLVGGLGAVSTPGAVALDLVTRVEWGAKPPVMAMTAQTPTMITIHHTATRQKPKQSTAAKLKSLQAFSQSTGKLADGRTKKAWADVPYHYYIAANGDVAEGRNVGFAGDTNTEYDPTGHIGIVVEGNFEKETPTPQQIAALVDLVATLAKRHHIGTDRIGGHRDRASTACPGKNLTALMSDIKADVARRLKSPD